MNSSSLSSSTSATADTRALVLGGGGAAGNAWLIGVLAGLSQAGLDVTAPELTIGTSAGATAAAQLTAAAPEVLLQAILDAPAPDPSRRPRPGTAPVSGLELSGRVIAAADSPQAMRRGMGAASLALDPGDGVG